MASINIRRGLQRISAVLWCAIALMGFAVTLAVSSDHYRYGNMGKVAEVVLIGAVISLAIGYGGHKLVCWLIAGFAADGPK